MAKSRRYALIVALILIAAAAVLGTAGAGRVAAAAEHQRFTALLSIPGVQGEGSGGTIELNSWQFGVQNSSTPGTGNGGGTGKVSLGELNISSKAGKHSNQLFAGAIQGTVYPMAVITVADSDGQSPFLVITLNNTLISKYQLGQGAGQGGTPPPCPPSESGGPTENFSITYAEVAIQFTPQK